MKESKFIELLNLYVDHEITAADAALLEAEIERSPARRHVYRQYCQMQKACTVLAHDFGADETPASADVIQFPVARRTKAAWGYAAGLVAVAACAAFVFVGKTTTNEQGRGLTATPLAMQTVAQSDFTQVAKATVNARPVLQPVFAGLANDAAEGEPALALAGNNQLDWMNGVQLQRVPMDDLRFNNQENFKPDVRANRSRQSYKAQVEMTAFQFQR